MENDLEEKTMILLEKAPGGDENSIDSLYNLERFKKFDETPIGIIDYQDYKFAWARIIGKVLKNNCWG